MTATVARGDTVLSDQQLCTLLVKLGLQERDSWLVLREAGLEGSSRISLASFLAWLGAGPIVGAAGAEEKNVEESPGLWVKDMLRRGVTMGDLLEFFNEHCGSTIFEDEQGLKPCCLPTTLAQKVVRWNQEHRDEISAGKKREMWTNLYAVVDLIVKPETKQFRVSASELWSMRGKRDNGCLIRHFVSHWWGEDFGEFVQSTYRYALHRAHEGKRGLSPAEIIEQAKQMTFYICAFSNNQWNLKAEMGDKVETSPFYRVLTAETTECVVMNLDMCAAALSRAWCGFEFFITHDKKKNFMINTRLGPLNEIPMEDKTSEAWIVHMFSILQSVEIQKCQASRRSDLDMIMREISTYQGTEPLTQGKTGADALNIIIKSQIAQEVLPLLARAGNAADVGQALDCGADPSKPDSRGLPPITVAIAKWGDRHEVVRRLQEAKADLDGTTSARVAVAMFEGEGHGDREAAIAQLKGAPHTARFYEKAIENAENDLNADKALLQASNLGSTDAQARKQGLKSLQQLPQAAAAPHLRKVVPLLGDSAAEVREAAVQVLEHIGAPCTSVKHIAISAEHLGGADADGRTVWHAAAGEASGVALQILLEASSDRATVLRMLAQEDSWHRTPVHCAAEADAASNIEDLARFGVALDKKMGPAEDTVPQNQDLEPEKMPVALVSVEGSFVLARAVKRNVPDTWDFELRTGGCKRFIKHDVCQFSPTPLELARLLNCDKAAAALEKRAHSDPQRSDKVARLASRSLFTRARTLSLAAEGEIAKKVVYIIDAGSTGCRLYRYTDLDFSGHLVGSEVGGGEKRDLIMDASDNKRSMWVLCPERKPPQSEVLLLTDCLRPSAGKAMEVLAEVVEKTVKQDFLDLAIWPRPPKPCVVMLGTGGVRALFKGNDTEASTALSTGFRDGMREWRRPKTQTAGSAAPQAETEMIEIARCEVITALHEARLEAAAVRHALHSKEARDLLEEFDPESVVGVFSIGGSSSQFTEFPSSCGSIPLGFKAAQDVLESRGKMAFWATASNCDLEAAYTAIKKSFDPVVQAAKNDEPLWARKFHGCWVALSSAAFAAGCVGLTKDEGCWQRFEPYTELAQALSSPWSPAESVVKQVQEQSLPIITVTAEKDKRVPIRDLAQVLTLRYLVETFFRPEAFLLFRRNWRGMKTNWPTGAAVEFFEVPERNLPLSVARDVFMLSVGDGQDVPGSLPSGDEVCLGSIRNCLLHIEEKLRCDAVDGLWQVEAAQKLLQGWRASERWQDRFQHVAEYFEQLRRELGPETFPKVAREAISHMTALRAMDRFAQMDLYVNKLLQFDCLYVELEKGGKLPKREMPPRSELPAAPAASAAPPAAGAGPGEAARLEAQRRGLEAELGRARSQLCRERGEDSVSGTCSVQPAGASTSKAPALVSRQLVLSDAEAVDSVVAIIQNSCEVTKIVNTFLPKAVPLEGGYRDVRVSIRTQGGLEAEVQLHMKAFFDLREDQRLAGAAGGKHLDTDTDEEQLLGSLSYEIKRRMAELAAVRRQIAKERLGEIENCSPKDAEDYLRALCHYAGLKRVLDDTDTAQECYEEALKMIEELQKLTSRSQSMEVLSVYVKQRLVKVLRRSKKADLQEAVKLMKQVAEWLEERLGGSHGLVLEVKTTLATVQAQGNDMNAIMESERMLSEVLPLLQARLDRLEQQQQQERDAKGKRSQYHGKLLKANNGQAWILLQLGKVKDASRLFGEVHEQRKRVHGSRHLETLAACHNYGLALAAEGDFTTAAKKFREAFQGRSVLLKANNKEVLASKHSLGLLLAGEADDEASRLLSDLKAEGGWAAKSAAKVLEEKGCDAVLACILERAWSFLRLRGRPGDPAVAKIEEGLAQSHERLLKQGESQGGEEEAWRLLLAGEVKLRMLRARTEDYSAAPADNPRSPQRRQCSRSTVQDACTTLRQVEDRMKNLKLSGKD